MILGVFDPESFPADTFTASELAEKKKIYRQKKEKVTDVFKRHGLEKLIGAPAPAEETQRRLAEGVKAADAVALLRDATSLMDELSDANDAPAEAAPSRSKARSRATRSAETAAPPGRVTRRSSS